MNGWINSILGVLAIALMGGLGGAIAGHNLLSRAVLCDQDVCSWLRFDRDVVRY